MNHSIRLAVLVMLVVLSSSVRAGPAFYVGANEADNEFSRITAADMDRIRTKHVLFGSRSFGLNCLSGINRLAAANPMYALNRSPSYDVNNGADIPMNVYDTFDLVHYLCTLNPDQCLTRLPEFDNFIRNRYHSQLDAVMIEYHLCEPRAFATYSTTLDNIRRDFPNIKVIYVTSGFMPVYNYAPNDLSAQFGTMVKNAYMGVQPLFDWASCLSTHADGTSAGNMMCTEFNQNWPNGDDTHPNMPFAEERLGKALLVTLYKIFCELPLKADAGDDQFVIDDNSDGSALVTLDGTGSYVQDGTITSYVWKEGTTQIATGSTAQANLAYGTHTIDLVITDNHGNTDRDDVQVVTKASSIHVVYQIAASADDTYMDSGGTNYTNTQIYWPYNDGARRSGMRWALNIPKGSTILEAKVWTKSNGQQDIQNSPIIQMNLFNYDNCPAFSTNPWTWAVTANSVTWNLGQVTWLANEWYATSDIRSIVQEFIDRSGYAPGKYLGLRGMGARPAGSIGWKIIYQWDNGTAHTDGAKLDILYAEPEPNHAPVAEAGAGQLLHDNDRNGSETVTLNGAASSDSDGTITSYVWKEGTSQIATGSTAQVSLAVGVHSISLVVTDDDTATASDAVVITVNALPVAHAGPDQNVTADGTGQALVTLDGSTSSDSDGNLVDWEWKEGSTILVNGGVAVRQVSLGPGTHTITLTVADQNAGSGQDTVVVTVDYRALDISAATSDDWVYQNTETTTADRHLAELTVSVGQASLVGETYACAFQEDGGAPADFTIQTTGTPNKFNIVGGRIGSCSTGPHTVTVTYTSNSTGKSDNVTVNLALRLLGDIDGDGDVDGDDKAAMNRRLNSLSVDYPDRAFNLTGDLDGLGNLNVDGDDKAVMNRLLNSLTIQ